MVDSIRGPEEEQIEALKSWWKEHGTKLTRIVFAIMVITVSVRYYHHHEAVKMKNASLEYDLLQNAISAQAEIENKQADAADNPTKPDNKADGADKTKPDDKAIEKTAQSESSDSVNLHAMRLIDDYKDTPYAAMAAMILAAHLEEKQDYDAAITKLDKIVPKDEVLLQIWHIRKAMALKFKGDFDGALKVLDAKFQPEFATVIEELKGDIYLAKGDVEKAKTAYLSAMDKDLNKQRPLLKMKIDDLS